MTYNSCCGFPAYFSISHLRNTLKNFSFPPQTVEICGKFSSQQGETVIPVISVNEQRKGQVCEAGKPDTKHFCKEVLLPADVLKVCLLCITKLVFQSLINVEFVSFLKLNVKVTESGQLLCTTLLYSSTNCPTDFAQYSHKQLV